MASPAPSTDRGIAWQTNRVPRALAVLAGGLAALAAMPLVGLPFVPATVVRAQVDQPSLCHPARTNRTEVAPARIRRAEKAIVSTFLSFSCPAPIEPAHTVLVTDAALVSSDAGVRRGLASLSARLAITSNAYARIGRIDFGPGARTMCGVINDPDEVALCLSGQGVDVPDPRQPDPAPTLSEAIRQAHIRLVRARDDDPPSPDNPVRAARDIIVLVAGAETLPDGVAEQAALCADIAPPLADAAAAGIEVRLACAGDGCATTCLADTARAAAGRGDAVVTWHEAVDELVGRAWASEARVWRLDVRESLNRGANRLGQPTDSRVWSVVPGSFDPPIPHDRESTALQWTLTQPMSKTVTLTYHVLSQMEHGTFTLRQSGEFSAVAIVQDTRGGFGLYRLNNPTIVVAGWGPFVAFLPRLGRTYSYVHSY